MRNHAGSLRLSEHTRPPEKGKKEHKTAMDEQHSLSSDDQRTPVGSHSALHTDFWVEGDVPPGHRSGFVAVIGRPNVGKSTFMNALIGEKVAIVSPKPQTTRKRIRGILTRPDAQIIFLDTPGIHHPQHKLGEFMVETAYRTIPDADVIVFMVDASVWPTEEDREIAERLRKLDRPKILLMNKADLISIEEAQPRADAYLELGPFDEWFLTSVLEGRDLDKILDTIVKFLPEGPRFYPADLITDQTEREIAAELVREAALHFLKQEVPHAVEVQVDEFKERENGMVYIAATIYVERDSQKRIVIGKGGSMLKQIGQHARRELEHFLGRPVYLDLWVKVRPKWRRNERILRYWGYKPK